jgi:uncharacterized repeat protein (TIGR03803 family)
MLISIFYKKLAMAVLAIGLLVETTHAQPFSVIYTFTNNPSPGNRNSSLILDSNTLYGTTYYGGSSSNGTVFKVNVDGSGYTVLKSFPTLNNPQTNSDGAWPIAGLVLSSNILYGTTTAGGLYGGGTLFKLNTSGSNFAVLKYASSSQADLIIVGNTLYGTSSYGGTNGTGTIFKLNTDGTGFAVLKSFSGNPQNIYSPSDGASPYAGLVFGGDILYGTTEGGGSLGYGTIFSINTNGTGYILLKSFPPSFSGDLGSRNHDGMMPISGLICRDGMLYGMAQGGGTNGYGTVFKVSIYGDDYSVLKTFAGSPDGAIPESALTLSGNTLYGTTLYGGTGNNGTLFKINVDGTGYAILKNFPPNISGTNNDGGLNYVATAGLTLSGGIFYSTTPIGGSYGSGTVFKLDLTPQLGAIIFSNSVPQVTITNFFGQSVDIQVATNLLGSWEGLTNMVLANGVGQFSDPSSTNFPQRFYRAMAQ